MVTKFNIFECFPINYSINSNILKSVSQKFIEIKIEFYQYNVKKQWNLQYKTKYPILFQFKINTIN